MWSVILGIITSVCIHGLDSDEWVIREDSEKALGYLSRIYDVRPQLKDEINFPRSLESKRRCKDLVRSITIYKIEQLARKGVSNLPMTTELRYPPFPTDIPDNCCCMQITRPMTVQEYVDAQILKKKTMEEILEELEEKDVSP